MHAIEDIRSSIRDRVEHGASLEQVDSELIDSLAEFDDEERSSLWLYAWHCAETRRDDPAPLDPADLITTG